MQMIFNTQLSKIVVHKKEIESKLCCLWKSLFKRFFQLQYIEACLQMLTAVLSSLYNQDMKAGSVDPRQMRVAIPFVKSSGRHLCAFFLSCTFQEVIHKQLENSLIIITPTISKQLFASFPLWGMMEIKLLFPWVTLAVRKLSGGDATVQGHSNLPLQVGWVTAHRASLPTRGSWACMEM